ncbi:mechanosensitive ion channel domain-containing protein [Candidatus Nardonella dryophthoridicola]|uniref:Small-conductance mechanosensitive channel n=1 Tax=endosymbiont of Rhynchophorus ferrugineus TaxID=1972133 RepID=A0A2Z5T8J0_9GAMM|nr:mechanosensitive ion channel domain-containing protein [Candidatus Nardonella dryophthoridicola]QTJ62914.1 mechanosensitive ion channel [Candidatus Nardonella dryophthoridicola]BBA84966.1 small-conductance mechanosensitive channel [endosymbiont of Rhynchophorus ferrugineus]
MKIYKILKNIEILRLFLHYKSLFLEYVFNSIIASFTLFIGVSLSDYLSGFIIKILRIRKIEETVLSFLHTLIRYSIIIFTLIITLNTLGIQTSSILTVIGAAGLAIGLALQGSLSNLAAGMLLVSFRHFRVGDFVDLSGISGIVLSVQLFSTTLRTLDGRIVVVPNNRILLGNIINFSTEPNKLIDVIISIDRDSNIKFVKDNVHEELRKEKYIIFDLPPLVQIVSISPSSIEVSIRAWVRRENIRIAVSNILERINNMFKNKGILPPCVKTKHIIIKNENNC